MNNVTANYKVPLLVLAGPTAVGKSAVALKLAEKLRTDIISADSAQVYRHLDVGTAKPSPEEQKMVKHHLIDIVNPDQNYSAADYQRDADIIIRQLKQEGKLAFVVGGTGLYIKALIYQYAFGSNGASRELRAEYADQARTEGLDQLYSRLRSVDPVAASKIHPNDQRRIIRALEVYAVEGKPISDQVCRTGQKESPYETVIFGLKMERDLLYRRIDERVNEMIKKGFLDEVRKLYENGYREQAPGMQVLGYRQLLIYLQGGSNWEETIAEIKKQTRNLAKRQMTWFRGDNNIKWIDINDQSSVDNISENICLKVKDMCL